MARQARACLLMQETLIRDTGSIPGSGILVWRILWTEDPGGLQLIGQQKVRYD